MQNDLSYIAREILADVLKSMQNAEEIGGPEGLDYLRLMLAIQHEAEQRIQTYTRIIMEPTP